ncbi:hypothetical protein [Laceyella sacchari]|nr:hypothetical protein [Laceyella sacchari]
MKSPDSQTPGYWHAEPTMTLAQSGRRGNQLHRLARFWVVSRDYVDEK